MYALRSHSLNCLNAFVPSDLPTSIRAHQNVTAVSKSDHPVYLWELEEAVAEFPRTRFVFAHCGMSRRVAVPF